MLRIKAVSLMIRITMYFGEKIGAEVCVETSGFPFGHLTDLNRFQKNPVFCVRQLLGSVRLGSVQLAQF